MTLIKFYHPAKSSYNGEYVPNFFNTFKRNFLPDYVDRTHQSMPPFSNITEQDNAYQIEMALPGVSKKEIRIEHENGMLTIEVDRHENNHAESNYALHEFNVANASRTFRIGERIEAEKISARYKNGLLTVTLPKKDEFVHKPARAIEVE